MADPATAPITPDQVDAIVHCFQILDWSPEQTATWLAAGWGVRRVKQLSAAQADTVLQTLINTLAAWAAADGGVPNVDCGMTTARDAIPPSAIRDLPSAADADFAALAPMLTPGAPVTADQVAELEALRQGAGLNDPHWRNFLLKYWNVDRVRALNQDQYAGARQILLRRQPVDPPAAARRPQSEEVYG